MRSAPDGDRSIGRPATARDEGALRRAHRLLLERPVLIRAKQRDEYLQVARHLETLARWHKEHTGWSVYANDHAGIIRLWRRASQTSSGIWEPWKSDVTLHAARDYACLVYVLWFARSPVVIGRGGTRQALLSDLRTHIAQRSAIVEAGDYPGKDQPVQPFDFTRRREDHYSLRRALKALEDLGAVIILDELSAAEPGSGGEISEALIEFTDVVESLIVELNLDAVQRARDQRPDPFSLDPPVLDDATSLPVRRAWRTLLLGPSLLRRDDGPAFRAVQQHRAEIEGDVDQLFGYALELTPVYARLVRTSGTSLDQTPSLLNYRQRGIVQPALLLCSAIRAAASAGRVPKPDENGCLTMPRQTLATLFQDIFAEHHLAWGSELSAANPNQLLNRVCDILRTAGLLRGPDEHGDVLVLPTAARYHVTYEDFSRGGSTRAQ